MTVEFSVLKFLSIYTQSIAFNTYVPIRIQIVVSLLNDGDINILKLPSHPKYLSYSSRMRLCMHIIGHLGRHPKKFFKYKLYKQLVT